jgi:hypothetical protein
MLRIALALALLLTGGLAPAAASEWGGMLPGVTTIAEVRARYGAPTKETPRKVEGYDTVQWLYDGPQAPTGLYRMTVEFGLLTPEGYKATVVRVFQIEPKPLIFERGIVLDGWGIPDLSGRQGEREVFIYEAGLVVTFDRDGVSATSMIFTIPKPAQAPADAPAAPAPAPAPKP